MLTQGEDVEVHALAGRGWSVSAIASPAGIAVGEVSAEPVAPVPLHQVEVGTNWSDYTVQCRIDVVTPNLLICTKGALILRDDGKDGYVFALHVATKTIEVYRLSDHEMLYPSSFGDYSG